MKTIRIALLSVWSASTIMTATLSAAAEAAASARGTTATIAGRVLNAATGQYLSNARVSVKGTNVTVFTDEVGVYRIVDAPAGQIVLDIFYTGLIDNR